MRDSRGLQNVKFEMPSIYPSAKDQKLDVQCLSPVGEVWTADMQVGISGIQTAFKAMGVGVITQEAHAVEEEI